MERGRLILKWWRIKLATDAEKSLKKSKNVDKFRVGVRKWYHFCYPKIRGVTYQWREDVLK